MRPIFFILGLAFVGTVLIANVDALKCYFGNSMQQDSLHEVECRPEGKECAVLEVIDSNGKQIGRGCLYDQTCDRPTNQQRCTKRCNADLCNGEDNKDDGSFRGDNDDGPSRGAMTSIPPAPLLIAFITGVIAAMGI